jgi:hypothetical protein
LTPAYATFPLHCARTDLCLVKTASLKSLSTYAFIVFKSNDQIPNARLFYSILRCLEDMILTISNLPSLGQPGVCARAIARLIVSLAFPSCSTCKRSQSVSFSHLLGLQCRWLSIIGSANKHLKQGISIRTSMAFMFSDMRNC